MSFGCFLILLSTLNLARGQVNFTPTSSINFCVGDDVTFSCTGGAPPFVWSITGLEGRADVKELGARTLNGASYPRYSSPDRSGAADPSKLTIMNIQSSELGATVLCKDYEDQRRASATLTLSSLLSVGPPMCTFTPMVSDLSTNTTCGFSVSWTTPSCSSGWLTTDVQMAYNVFVRPVGGSSGSSEGTVNRMSTSQFEVTDLFPNTSYNIMMILKNRCGEGSSVTVSGTTMADCKVTSPPEPLSTSLPTGAIVGIVIAVIVIIIIIIVVVIVVVFLVLKKGDGARDVGASRSKSTEPIKQFEVKENEYGPTESKNQLHYADLDHTGAAHNPRSVPANLESEHVEYVGTTQA